MSIKWIFAILVFMYSFNMFAADIQFDELIEESHQDQMRLAAEIQRHLGIVNEKTLKDRTASAVSLEGFNLARE
ncbi:MAG: hypothetical protein H7061_02480 [Bdellovibrionaceae bacterium]|nr:hypothetical protein [Bdellovibrio sp.]